MVACTPTYPAPAIFALHLHALRVRLQMYLYGHLSNVSLWPSDPGAFAGAERLGPGGRCWLSTASCPKCTRYPATPFLTLNGWLTVPTPAATCWPCRREAVLAVRDFSAQVELLPRWPALPADAVPAGQPHPVWGAPRGAAQQAQQGEAGNAARRELLRVLLSAGGRRPPCCAALRCAVLIPRACPGGQCTLCIGALHTL